MWVRIPVVTLVSLSKTLNYSCFSPPRGKWVPVRTEMVLVIDLASTICCTGCILPRELRWFKEWIKWPSDQGVVMLEVLWGALRVWKVLNKNQQIILLLLSYLDTMLLHVFPDSIVHTNYTSSAALLWWRGPGRYCDNTCKKLQVLCAETK